MKTLRLLFVFGLALITSLMFVQCSDDDDDTGPDLTPSTTELLVAKFTAAPAFDGEIDALWDNARKLEGTTSVPSGLGSRNTYYNEPDIGEEDLDIYEAFEGESQDFTIRAGYFGEDIYFLVEWEDADDSKDRESWYFDDDAKLWKGQHKYANSPGDKYYEDKFAFLFPIGTVDGFTTSTCFAVCHSSGGVITTPKDKHTRHYTTTPGEVVDMWHWKRVRSAYGEQIDDQRIVYVDDSGEQGKSGSNGRGGDEGSSGYSGNSQTLNNGTDDVKVPKYVIPDQTDYYWIGQNDIDNGTAKLITAVDADGVLTYNGGTIDPADGGYEEGTGAKRIPSVTTKEFEGNRGDIAVKAVYTGSGWVCEVRRKLNTNDPEDAVFDITAELPFGFATFDNAAIAHAIKPNLLMKFEQ